MSSILKLPLLVPKLVQGTCVFKNMIPNPSMMRRFIHLMPSTPYDPPRSEKMKFFNVIRKNWEVLPLFAVTGFALTIMVGSIIWAVQNKVDVVYKTHSCNNISRTMNLCHPTVHKFIIINQEYKPWPKMQSVLDKMRYQEKQVELFLSKCKFISNDEVPIPTQED